MTNFKSNIINIEIMLIGIVGKANVGKSTFFKALTLAEIEIANYPFTTIKANHGLGFVKIKCIDKEFNVKCAPKHGYCTDNHRFVPVELLDVAGLVSGAHLGKGMGNQFLDDLNQADCLIHVIDVSGSTNEKGEAVEPGTYDPSDDIKFLETELDKWYERLIKKSWEEFAKKVQQEQADVNKALAKHLAGLRVTEKLMEETIKKLNLSLDITSWDEDVLLKLASELRRKTKPMIIACNKMDVVGAEKNFKRLQKEFKNLIPCSAESELALKEAAKHELIKYIPGENNFEMIGTVNDKQKNGLEFIKKKLIKYKSTGVQNVINAAVFDLLKYIAVYPVANSHLEDKDKNILPDVFLVEKDTTALEFAFKVHTDIGKNFIKAIDLKTKQVIGKESTLKNRDVIEIVI